MPNAVTHRLGAAIAISTASAYNEYKNGEITPAPIMHGVLAALLGTLPDIIEPAYDSHHRKFFHSIGFAGLLGYGLYQLYQWDTKDEMQRLIKTLGFIAGSAYLVHLTMDSTTPRSLPII